MKIKLPILSSECPSDNLVHYELEASQVWLIRLRWVAGIGVILGTWGATHILGLGMATGPLYALGVGILLYNALFARWMRRACRPDCKPDLAHRLERLQILADWLAMTLLIHFSGGVESPALFYFIFHIVLASILLSARETYLFAALATLLVGGVFALECRGILPHLPVRGLLPTDLCRSPTYILGVLFFFASTLFVTAYLTTRTTGRLRRREAEMRALYQSAQAISSTLDLQEVLDRLTRETARAMNVRACTIRLLDETGDRLCLESAYGLPEEYLQKGCLLVRMNPLVQEVLSGKPVAVDDITKESRLQYLTEAIEAGIRSTLTVPLPGRSGPPIGIIRVYCNAVHRFSDEDIAFLSAIAAQGSVAIENALAYQRLQELEEAKRKFVLTVTHELRSPVGVVRSLLRTLAGGYAGELTPLQQDMLYRALHRADFLQTLIDDLLDLAAGKTGLRVAPAAKPVDLTAIVAQITDRYRVPAEEKQLTLTLEGADSPLHVRATEEEMDRVFNNLISNAIKYTPAGGRVTITLKRTGDNVQVEITDTGIGIPEDALPHLFEEFYRAPNAKAQVKEGTGLGLVVAKEIVTRYGGRIGVASTLGKGTTFTVTLPALRPATQV